MGDLNEKHIKLPNFPISVTVGDTVLQGTGEVNHTIKFNRDNFRVWASIQPQDVEISFQGRYAFDLFPDVEYKAAITQPPVTIGHGELFPTYCIHITEETFNLLGFCPLDTDIIHILTMHFHMLPEGATEPIKGFVDFTSNGITGDVDPEKESFINYATGEIKVWIPHPLYYKESIDFYYSDTLVPSLPREYSFPAPPVKGQKTFVWQFPEDAHLVMDSIQITTESLYGEIMQISSNINGKLSGDIDKDVPSIVNYESKEISVTFKEIVAPEAEVVVTYATYQSVSRFSSSTAVPITTTIKMAWENVSRMFDEINKTIINMEETHKYR